MLFSLFFFFFFFNDTATTEIYTLSLHDALPISSCVFTLLRGKSSVLFFGIFISTVAVGTTPHLHRDRKSTRLNSSHPSISYAVFCLKKKKKKKNTNKKHIT